MTESPRVSPVSGRYDTHDIPWINISGEEVPALGVVQVASWDVTENRYNVIKPTEYAEIWLINSGTAVADGEQGHSRFTSAPQTVLVEGSNLSAGHTVSPVGGTWSMAHGSRFLMTSDIDAYGRATVIENPQARRRRAVLLEHLDCADDIYSAPKTALAKLLFVNSSNLLEDEQLPGGGDRTVTVSNFFTGIEFTAMTYVKIEYIDQFWEIYAADCPGFCESE
jgi:hypothetical protein